jgi:hypothetical protein
LPRHLSYECERVLVVLTPEGPFWPRFTAGSKNRTLRCEVRTTGGVGSEGKRRLPALAWILRAYDVRCRGPLCCGLAAPSPSAEFGAANSVALQGSCTAPRIIAAGLLGLLRDGLDVVAVQIRFELTKNGVGLTPQRPNLLS